MEDYEFKDELPFKQYEMDSNIIYYNAILSAVR